MTELQLDVRTWEGYGCVVCLCLSFRLTVNHEKLSSERVFIKMERIDIKELFSMFMKQHWKGWSCEDSQLQPVQLLLLLRFFLEAHVSQSAGLNVACVATPWPQCRSINQAFLRLFLSKWSSIFKVFFFSSQFWWLPRNKEEVSCCGHSVHPRRQSLDPRG